MKTKKDLSRREFVKKSTVSGIGLSIIPAHVMGGPGRIAPSDRMNVALMGCGMMGLGSLRRYLKQPEYQIIAVCDPEKDSTKYPGRPGGAPGGREEGRRRVESAYADNIGKGTYKGCNAYADFRELLEKEKGLDAVFNYTPDHLHAPINIAAMKRNINVATHKPISNYLNEVRASIDYANNSGVPTHCYFFQDPPKTYTMTQLIKQGVIGKVTELHRWTNRPTWPQAKATLPEPQPIPDGFDWQLWLGPSTDRPYSPEYTHFVYRGWFEFGGGVLCDMAFYGFWRDFRVLNLGVPVSAKADCSIQYELDNYVFKKVENKLSFPWASRIHWDVPVLDKNENVDVYWYDGNMKPPTPRAMVDKGVDLSDRGGVLFIGEKGVIYTSFDRYDNMQIFGVDNGDEIAASIDVPEEYIALSKNEMNNALRGIRPSRGNFKNVQPISETIALGNLAIRMGGQRLQWDSQNLKVTNVPEANQYATREYRPGWEL
jgi:hypothetical protein